RYAVDYFSPAFDPDAVKDFGKMLRKLQNGFGFLNDLATAEGLPDLFIDHPEQKRLQKLAGKVIDWHEERAHETWDKAVSRWRSLSKAPKFWL
ncbi:MAG: CHAD domain-containing protein, partial [Pseudomonadota bacterium]